MPHEVWRRFTSIDPNLDGSLDAFRRSSNRDLRCSVNFDSGMISSQSIGVTQERLAPISSMDS